MSVQFQGALRAIASLVPLSLSACSLTGTIIRQDITQYQNAAAEAANNVLLQNIIRAAYKEPIHFQELSQVHGAASLSGGISPSIPIGGYLEAAKSVYSLGANASISTNPSFDLGNADNQQFFNAISQPINPEAARQLLLSGLDPRLAITLLLENYQNVEREEVQNRLQCENSSCINVWQSFSLPVTIDTRVRINIFKELIPIGPILGRKDIGDLKTFSGLDFSKQALKSVGAKIQLYNINTRYALCLKNSTAESLIGFIRGFEPKGNPPAPCSATETVAPLISSSHPTIELRSVYGMIQFLGQIVAKQSRDLCASLGKTVGELGLTDCKRAEIIFNVARPLSSSTIARADWRGLVYNVPGRGFFGDDHTADTFSALSYLFNLNKDVQSVASTPSFRSVQ